MKVYTCKMKTTPISEETRTAILEAAWALMLEAKKPDIGQAEIAAKAGVSRQTIYMAFGNRAGLLTAMVRHVDTGTDHVQRLSAISHAAAATPEDFRRYLDIWLDYLPRIYPVAILLEAAALTDAAAQAALDDRMKDALLAGFKRMLGLLAKGGHLAPGLKPDAAAELVWSLVHLAMWRLLVVGCGWRPAEFRRSRLDRVWKAVLKDDAG